MSSSIPEIVGRNVKTRREKLGMTAKTLGEHLGRCFPRKGPDPKPWPTSAVFQLESGGRSMTPEEVAALAQVLDCPVSDLFALDDDVEEVRIGALTVPAAEWRILPAASSVDDLVSLRLFHTAQQVKQSMRLSNSLFENLVRDVTTHARASSTLRERIEQEYEIGRGRDRRQLVDQARLDDETVTDEDVDLNLSPATETAREVLKSLGRE
ncbi:MAG: helix-turn-helix domain-containing protein [Brachybacterium tyrofermentans]|uniref:helix-turn-helix domain-containing protein n=1 Tax=Brachybacterium tyrofermentans TaxID=47848 RepID=UPI003F93DE38